MVACTTGVPCTARLLVVHGFVSIPVMAGSAFLLITALLFTLRAVQAGTDGQAADGLTEIATVDNY